MKFWRLITVSLSIVALVSFTACSNDAGDGAESSATGQQTGEPGGQNPGDNNKPDDTPVDKDVVQSDPPVEDPTKEEDTTLRVDSLDPSVGPGKGGSVVTILGNGFKKGSTLVYFGVSQAFDIFILNENRLTCTTPPGNPGLVDVIVQEINSEQTAKIELGYRYESNILIMGIEPQSGDIKGGEPVTITGSGFSQGDTTVLMGERTAINVQVIDDATITLTTPAADEPGPIDIFVSNDKGAAVLNDGFEYYAKPKVTSVVPAAGLTAGGTTVKITGSGFLEGARVFFGESEAVIAKVQDSSTIIASTPAGEAGSVNVLVETDYGTGGLADGFVYTDAATNVTKVLTVQPGVGSVDGGDKVVVTALGLLGKSDTLVSFDGNDAEVTFVDPEKHVVHVTTPAGDPGKADVTVTTTNGTDTLKGGFKYQTVLSVTAVEPGNGPAEGGTDITITGSGFSDGAGVRVGALPCKKMTVVDESTIECTTPPGSPGAATVTVNQGNKSASLKNGFVYESGTVGLYVVDPNTGSKAGGTFVRLMGAGFKAPVKVTFAGNPASHVKVVNSTLIYAKTPPGEVGAVDIVVESDSGTAVLPQSYTYFDPVALYGGTWGPDVDGSVNITVLDGGNGSPVPDCFVMLKTNPDTPYQGYTNSDGQITFSGKDVNGEQMVSASKQGYASNSVIKFDASNITIYLIPTPPPSMGPPPPGASVSGKVFGLGKYVVPPPGDCSKISTANLQGDLCKPCTSDDQCSKDLLASCTTIGGTGKFCTTPCVADSDCPSGFSCLNAVGKEMAQCQPAPGKKQARCYTTVPSIFSGSPDDETPFIVNPDGTYKFGSRLGELAIVCLGGVVNPNNPNTLENFTPMAFGVKRHVFVKPGENPDNDITLNHPLTKTIKIRLDNPPFDTQVGPVYNAGLSYWDMGSDGIFFHRKFQDGMYGASPDIIRIPRQPSAFTGDVYDVTFTLVGVAFSSTQDKTPSSWTLLTNLKTVEDDLFFKLEAGQWTGVHSGVTRTINSLWGFADNDIWGVGDDGGIIHSSSIGWGIQASPTSEHLYGVWGSAANDIWAVGAKGTLLRFDGAKWTASKLQLPGSSKPISQDLRGVWGSSATDVWVAAAQWGGIFHWDGTKWSKASVAGADLRSIHGTGSDDIWAVGRYGNLRHYDGNKWTSKSSGTNKDLHGVHAVSATEAYAVGRDGAVVHWNGTKWTAHNSGTTRSLRAVWAMGSQNVYAVGDASQLLHWDGQDWVDQTVPNMTSHNAMLALWGNPETGKAVSLGASELLMGPMLQVPEQQNPKDSEALTSYHLGFKVKPGVPAHFNRLMVAIPTLFGDVPVWQITTDGDVFDFDLPDFPNIEGTPGIPNGNMYKWTIIRAYKDNFDIDNYDFMDFNTLKWRSWAIDVTFFTK